MSFFVFNSVFNFFYLVQINKLIIFNVDADVAFFNVKKYFLLIQATWTLIYYYLFMSFATSVFSVSDVTAGTKMEAFFKIGTKSGKNKTQGLKWKSPKNVETKSDFIPKKNQYGYIF